MACHRKHGLGNFGLGEPNFGHNGHLQTRMPLVERREFSTPKARDEYSYIALTISTYIQQMEVH